MVVAPKFSDTLTLFQPGGAADSAPPSQKLHQKFPRGYISVSIGVFQEFLMSNSGEFSLNHNHNYTRFVTIIIKTVFSHLKSVPLVASGDLFRNQLKVKKRLSSCRGLVSCGVI